MTKKTMDDLREVILELLVSSTAIKNSEVYEKSYVVPKRLLRNLQAEYNIYFVEPDEKQLEVI